MPNFFFITGLNPGKIWSGQVVILKARPAMDAAVMSLHLSLSPTSSSSLTRFRPVVMPYNDKLALFKSFSILSNVHPSLLWACNRSFSCWLPIMNYGWPPLFAHSRDMSIPFHSPFPNSILCYFLPCPDPHLRIAYSIRKFTVQERKIRTFFFSSVFCQKAGLKTH